MAAYADVLAYGLDEWLCKLIKHSAGRNAG